ncbi:hypothetical protein D9756_009754 [Leucocoprinus leucothites]|uniref:DUF6533 domain-containing protein n=1 Tax=Leucocoprinus leucothites TaxID=201217 RepID=A0A8H5FT93_9AGAR|nr:hypothetical protein D9756_009754 [Leucoagaricus leucothites]
MTCVFLESSCTRRWVYELCLLIVAVGPGMRLGLEELISRFSINSSPQINETPWQTPPYKNFLQQPSSDDLEEDSMRQALSTVLHYIQVGQYIHTASYTVAAFEWLITIDLEILHVWNSPWTVTKVVFLINRYLPIVDFCLGYSVKHATHIDTCRTLTKAFTCVYVADYILAIRTCAVWGFNKILIAVLVLAQAGSFFFNVYYFNVDITVKGLIRIPPLDGCFLVQPEGHGIFIEFTILAVYDTAMLILMIYPTIKEYSRQRQIGEKTLVSGSEIVASIIAEGE